MILLYRLIVNILYAALYPYGLYRMSRGSEMWRDRLGKAELSRCDIWLHASSVGEVTVVSYLVAWLKSQSPNLKFHVTTMTANGYATAKNRLNGLASVSYFPVDRRSVIIRTLAMLQPKMVVIAETEIWPNLILECGRREIGLVKVNARLSSKAFKKYLRVRGTMGRLLANYDRIFCKTEDDFQRYRHLGAVEAQTVVGGDMKFDAPLLEKTGERMRSIRGSSGIDEHDFLFVCGSTRPGEEIVLLEAYRVVRRSYDNLRIILAPRHLDRLEEVRCLVAEQGLRVAMVGESTRDAGAVLLVGQMGILNELYRAADLAFVGGTLVDIGGHNLLEPVWAQTPVVYGPYLSNVGEAAEYIEAHNYGVRVTDSSEIAPVIADVISGKRKFNIKTAEDLSHSPVAMAGNYILGRLARG